MDLDDELRRLFADERLEVPARPGAGDVIVAGAERVRRHRIAAVTASGALAAVAVAAAGVLLAGGHQDAMPPANRYERTPTSTTTTTTTTPATQLTTTQSATTGATGTVAAPPSGEQGDDEPATQTPDPPPVLAYPVIGPTGFGALELGQSLAQAQATGMVGQSTPENYGGCTEYQLMSDGEPIGWVYFAAGDTVNAISPGTAQTPEGAGAGWTVEQVAAVYPDLDVATTKVNGYADVRVPGNDGAAFHITFDQEGIAHVVTLQSAAAPCFGG